MDRTAPGTGLPVIDWVYHEPIQTKEARRGERTGAITPDLSMKRTLQESKFRLLYHDYHCFAHLKDNRSKTIQHQVEELGLTVAFNTLFNIIFRARPPPHPPASKTFVSRNSLISSSFVSHK